MEYDYGEAQDPVPLSLPVGLVLLFTFLLCMCCFFSCCLHWEKLRSLIGHRYPPLLPVNTAFSPPDKISPVHTKIWKETPAQSLSVLMPGDEVPRFIAMACPPCAAALVVVEEQKPSRSIPDSSGALSLRN
ncbi:uncharacterized protein At5g65660-like isoform X1 [Cucurbita maxima]|uniref:Uncharacterized protein At5g65660-like isoform X1 n=1 Tax=Cucurbita maxima TaxID=3661 RepID=A0A6J1J0Z8_CUCMA|nr:uncharacterized protein At5g65660-like isoform X1 [Cucurbita maxima]